MRDTKINRRYLLVYTAVFAALALAVFFPFLTSGKSFVGNGDGKSQYILQLRYMGEWLRECLDNFMHGNFALRTYDFTIGMGDDINSIVRFHPLDYLSVFVPAQYTEQLYAVLIFLRLYIAGIAFSVFGFHWKRSGSQVLAGSMVYLFCGYVFELGIVHPIYVAPMIVMPLLLLGAEYMMDHSRRHSFALFSIMVYLGFTSNYYFMYINSVALLVYVLIRFFRINKENRVREFFTLLVRMVSAYLVGLMLSAVTLFPTLQRYLNSYRSSDLSESGSLLFYEDPRRYFGWVINLISPLEASGNGTHLNFAVIVLPAIVVLFLSGKERWQSLKRIFIALFLFLLIPLGGFIMAVMHTENNRWVYLISLAAGMSVTFVSDSLCSLGSLQKKVLAVVTVVYDAGVAVLTVIYPPNVYHLLAAFELTVTTLIILYANRKTTEGSTFFSESVQRISKDGSPDHAAATAGAGQRSLRIVLLITAVSTVLNGYFTFGHRFGNLTRYYAPAGSTETYYSESKYANYSKLSSFSGRNVWTDGFYRVDGIWAKSHEDNASVQLGYPGVQIYNSVLNASQISYMLDTRNIGLTTMLHIRSLDGRTGAEALAGVRYFQTEEEKSLQRPYGFNTRVWSDGKMAIWENDSPLAFGFTTDRVIRESDLKDLSGAQIEEAMLSAAVLQDKDADRLCLEKDLTAADASQEAGDIRSEDIPLPDGGENIEKTADGYHVGKKNASVSLSYERKAGCDIMLELTGLMPHGFGSSMRVENASLSKKITLLSSKETYTLGRDEYLVSLGYAQKDEEDTLTLRFAKKGGYDLEGIRILYIPRAGYEEKIASANEYCLKDVKFEDDAVSGTIHVEENRLMVLQIPYSKGWSARVNGKDVPLFKTDECYMGLALDKGDNEVCLVYHTPGGMAGMLASLAGLVLFAAGLILGRRKVPYSAKL